MRMITREMEDQAQDPDLSHLTTQIFQDVYEPSDDTWLTMDALKEEKEFLWKRFGLKNFSLAKNRQTTKNDELNNRTGSIEAKWVANRLPVCVEIGSGSGVLITHLSRLLSSHAPSDRDFRSGQRNQHCLSYAVDINPHACQATRSTMKQNHIRGEVVRCNLLSGIHLALQKGIDIVVFNPPYVPTPINEILHSDDGIERSWAGGERGRVIIDEFIQEIDDLLSARGVVYLVLLASNDIVEVSQLMENIGLEVRILQNKRRGIENLYVIRYSRPV
jgi:release factor glutamine methyltransferase